MMSRLGPAALALVLVACAPESDKGAGGNVPERCELAADPVCYETAFDAMCWAFWCGGRTGSLDEDGCLRQPCKADADCPEGRRCYVIAMDAPCKGSDAYCTVEEDSSCKCLETADCGGHIDAHCIPSDKYPPEGDCDITGLECVELEGRSQSVLGAQNHQVDRGGEALLPMLIACETKVVAARMAEPCNVSACEILCERRWCLGLPEDCVPFCETTAADAQPGALDAVLDAVLQHPEICGDCAVCAYAGDTGGLCEQLFEC